MEETNLNREVTDLLTGIANEHGLYIFNIKHTRGSVKGDGYLGIITAVEITSIDDPIPKSLNLIVKSVLKGETIRNEVPLSQVYEREVYMYTTIIPAFQEFVTEKALPPINCFAKCYRTTLSTDNESLILENLKTKGFKVWERRTAMNEEHIEMVLKEYGRFHAISMALKDQFPAQFEELAKPMTDLVQVFCEKNDFIGVLTGACRKVVEILEAKEDKELKMGFLGFIDDIPNFMKSLFNCSPNHVAIVHGDCWTNNMLFKYKDDSTNVPNQVCFIDLQIARVAPPVIDIAYFFYSCSSGNILDNCQHYLNTYYKSLADYLTQLGSEPHKIYPYSVFLEQWKKYAKFGLLMATIIIKVMLSEQEEVLDFNEFVNEKSIVDLFSYSIAKEDEYNERMRNLILHFVKNGYL